jgi:hypothetical protein
MNTKYILGGLSVVFLVMAFLRMARDRGRPHPQSRTWLLVGVMFGAVSAWLWYRG